MKKEKSLIINSFYGLLLFFLLSCGAETKEENTNPEDKTSSEKETSEPADNVDTSIETVKIGGIEFSEQNLAVTTYRNGDPIPQAKTAEEWKAYAEKKEGCYAFPDFSGKNSEATGLVYNGYAVSDERNLAPAGWKIPSRKDWETAIASVGDAKAAGKNFKSESGWKKNGDNSTGFNALPLPFFAGDFNHNLQCIYYWSSSSPDNEYHYHFDLSGDNDEFASWYDHDSWGLYVRCIKE